MAKPKQVEWSPLPTELAAIAPRLDQIFRSWEGTPYKPGGVDRGIGVDCVRFVAKVFDDLRGTRTDVQTLPDDAALHNREAAIAAMLRLRNALAPNDMIQPVGGVLEVEPGDVLVTGPRGGGPGHAIFVGCERNVFWESSGTGVRRIGLQQLERDEICVFYAFRPADKAFWVEA